MMNVDDNAQATNKSAASQPRKNSWWVTALLIGAVAVIAVFPLFFNNGDPTAEEQFAGTDATATDTITEIDPDYKPWFEPLVGELPSEVESGLFALQAGIGAGVLGYVIGYYRGKSKPREDKRGNE
jgi:cobalt/nickel transport protein